MTYHERPFWPEPFFYPPGPLDADPKGLIQVRDKEGYWNQRLIQAYQDGEGWLHTQNWEPPIAELLKEKLTREIGRTTRVQEQVTLTFKEMELILKLLK